MAICPDSYRDENEVQFLYFNCEIRLMKKLLAICFVFSSLITYSQFKLELEKFELKTDTCFTKMSFLQNKTNFKFNSKLNFNIPKSNNYIAIYNSRINSYDYYPSKTKIRVDLNSSHSYLHSNKKIRYDSLNPHGANTFGEVIAIGILHQLFLEIFE